MNISVGELQNRLTQKAEQKKEAIKQLKRDVIYTAKQSSVIGYKIVWYGFCSSIVVYLTVKAFMIAIQ